MKKVEKALASLSPRAHYARAVVEGKQALSGADLRGKARQYGAHYYRQRLAAVKAAVEAGAHIRRGAHGKLTLEWGRIPAGARGDRCAMGLTVIY